MYIYIYTFKQNCVLFQRNNVRAYYSNHFNQHNQGINFFCLVTFFLTTP